MSENTFFLYARKSTDQEDKQVLSIESQLSELRSFAEKEGLEVIDEFVEKESAKTPGRKVFEEMCAKIEDGAAIIGGLGWYITTRPSLPPTTARGHTEGVPQAHITDTPIPESIQRHMLEHADGGGPPGVIIQYNCKDFSCESDLVQKLTALVKEYPDNVYLAPNSYDGKIILTKIGEREILDGFDEQTIKDFIE